jgi:lysophospholipase L1-like esterase
MSLLLLSVTTLNGWAAETQPLPEQSPPAFRAPLKNERAPLVAVGDSMTAGYHLVDPDVESYPSLVAADLGLPVVNLATKVGDIMATFAGRPTYATYDAVMMVEARLVPANAAIVLINVGVSDVDAADLTIFSAHYGALLSTIRYEAPLAQVVIINLRHMGSPAELTTIELMDAFINSLPYMIVDLRCAASMYFLPNFVDSVHPSLEGHAAAAKIVEAALKSPEPPAQLCPPYAP